MNTEASPAPPPLPSPLPSPLSYPNAIGRPAIVPVVDRDAVLRRMIGGLMALTGCSRADARQALATLLKTLEEPS